MHVMNYFNEKSYDNANYYDISSNSDGPKNIAWNDANNDVCISDFEQKHKDCGENIYEIQLYPK